jgi:hypothetical protein
MPEGNGPFLSKMYPEGGASVPEQAREELAAGTEEVGSGGVFALFTALLGRMDNMESRLRQEIQMREAALRQEMQAGDAALRQEISALRQEMQAGDAALRQEIASLRLWMIGTLLSVVVSFIVLFFTIRAGI